MVRLLVAVLASTLALVSVQAQVDTSLTREFGHLSAKERARIAKQEQQDAAADTRYQAVMAEAETLFQAKRYDESLDRYKAARTMRPLNVYPKVKIQDLQAFIAKRDSARAEAVQDSLRSVHVQPVPVRVDSVPAAAAPIVLEKPKVEPPTPTEQGTRAPSTEAVHTAEVRKEPVRTGQKEPVVMPKSGSPAPVDPAPVLDGLEERMYVEGRATVLERKLSRNGRVEVYRKVTHPWGQIVHFRDGVAISDREWAEVFP